jgi:hypothetical protein
MSNFMPKLGPNDFSDNSHPQIDQSVSSCCQGGGNAGSVESFKSNKTVSTQKKSSSNVGLWVTLAISILLIILSWWFYDKLLDIRNKIIDKVF